MKPPYLLSLPLPPPLFLTTKRNKGQTLLPEYFYRTNQGTNLNTVFASFEEILNLVPRALEVGNIAGGCTQKESNITFC